MMQRTLGQGESTLPEMAERSGHSAY